MGLGEGSFAEARHTARKGPLRVPALVLRQELQQERLQPCARHQSHLQRYVSIDKVLNARACAYQVRS